MCCGLTHIIVIIQNLDTHHADMSSDVINKSYVSLVNLNRSADIMNVKHQDIKFYKLLNENSLLRLHLSNTCVLCIIHTYKKQVISLEKGTM